jgi:ABC-type multidrug transport system ATPase subunit
MMHEPAVIFLDEPTSGVDPSARRRVWDLIYTIAEAGTTVFATTHYLDEVERCDRVGLLDAGRLVALGTPDELKHATRECLGAEFFAVRTPAATQAAALLATRSDVRQASLYGSTVRVALAHGSSPSGILDLLTVQGIQAQIEPTEPTMEDAFTALLAGARQAA